MENRALNYLNCNQRLRESIAIFKEAFVSFYGEENRAEIEERFNNALFIGYQTPSQLTGTLNKIKENKSTELKEFILKNNKSDLDEKDLFYSYNFDFCTLMPIYKYKQFYEQYKLGDKGRLDVFLDDGYNSLNRHIPNMTKEEFLHIIEIGQIPDKYQNIPFYLKNHLEYYMDISNCTKDYLSKFEDVEELLKKIDKNIDKENFEELLKSDKFGELNNIASLFDESLKDYNLYISNFSDYFKKEELSDKTKQDLSEKYYAKFIKENIDLIPLDKRNGLEEFFEDPKKRYKINEYVIFIFGYSLKGFDGLECFSSEKDDELLSEDTPSWKVDETKTNRIKFFQMNGIDLGNNYDDYLNNEEVQKIWPSKERIKNFFESKDRIINEFNIDYFNSIEENVDIRKEIETKGLLDKDDAFNAELYERKSTCVNPNISLKGNDYQLNSLVIINFDIDNNYTDHNIVHELNHLYELKLQSLEEHNYSMTCGWDIVTGKINQIEREKIDTTKIFTQKRNYELFNEIINEKIAQEISEIMQRNNIHIFDNPNDSKYKGCTSYEHTSHLVNEFYNEFKDEILKSRSNGNIEIIFNAVGKDNFDELNSLFHIFYENFSGLKIYSVRESISKNEENEQTKIYYDLIRRKDEILNKMRMHKENNMSEIHVM